MIQTSSKRKKISIASIIIVVFVLSSIGALVLYKQLMTNSISPKFSVNVLLNQTKVIQGNNLQAQVNVTSIGKPENITLSSNVGSIGMNYTFEPSIGTSNFTSLLTLSVPDSVPTGNYSLVVSALGDGEQVNASCVISVLNANVTVSGIADLSKAARGSPIIERIKFTDTETNLVTTASSSYIYSQNYAIKNYSVTLQNEHTYSVTISYLSNPLGKPNTINNIMGFSEETISAGSFTVKAPVGSTTMTGQNFPKY